MWKRTVWIMLLNIFFSARAALPLYVDSTAYGSIRQHVLCPGSQESNDCFWRFFCFPPFPPFFYFFMTQSVSFKFEQRFHPSLTKLICERIDVSVLCMLSVWEEIVLWSENEISLKEGAEWGETLLLHLTQEVLSCPKSHISVLPLPTYSTKCHLEKKKLVIM